jgi:alpha-tubulin suppressor-like RCC1 family protein
VYSLLNSWGSDNNGQLGNGVPTGDQVLANLVVSSGAQGVATHFASITAGLYYSCARLTADNSAMCWGHNTNGQFADGTLTSTTSPKPFAGGATGFAAIYTGRSSTCVVFPSGALKCAGENNAGQLGNGSTTQSTTLVDVAGLPTQ